MDMGLEIGIAVLAALVVVCGIVLLLNVWFNHVQSTGVTNDRSYVKVDTTTRDRKHLDKRIAEKLDAAQIDIQISTAKAIWLAAAVCTPLVLFGAGMSPSIVAVGFAAGLMLPIAYVSGSVKKASTAFSGQLADALPNIAAALRSGQSLIAAIDSYAEHAEDPIRTEFERVSSDITIGIPFAASMKSVAGRMGSSDADLLAVTIAIQERTGASLADVIDQMGQTIRERERLRGKAKALTSSTGTAIKFMAAIPAMLLVYFCATSTTYLDYYKTPTGMMILVGCVVSIAIGTLVLKNIANIDVG